MEAGQQKLNNVMLKVCTKLPKKLTSNGPEGAAHNVCLQSPHRLLGSSTMVVGADVTHNVVGVSVAGVVASRDSSFVTYFSEVRAQTPFALEGLKTRQRKSEERILDLKSMMEKLLRRWSDANGLLVVVPALVLVITNAVAVAAIVIITLY